MDLTCRSIACCLLLVSTHLNAAPPLQEQAIVKIAANQGDAIEQGTGFLVSADGLVATAYHVVYGATRVDVFSQGEFYRDVPVVAVRPLTDLALIRIPVTPGTKYYRLADSPSTGAPGELLYVQGHPLGFPLQTLTAQRTQPGYLVSQQWTDDTQYSIFNVNDLDLLPLDVTAEPGMSGGPIVDDAGNVLAVFSGSLRRGRGYAWGIPIDYLRLEQMNRLDRQATDVDWPDFNFLREGLDFLRTGAPVGTEQVWQRCRTKTEELAAHWEAFQSHAFRLSGQLLVAAPAAAAARKGLTPSNASDRIARISGVLAWLEPYATDMADAAEAYEKSLSEVLAICYGEAALRAGPAETPLATYNNELAVLRFNERLEIIGRRSEQIERDGSALQSQSASLLERAFELLGNPGSDISDYDWVKDRSEGVMLFAKFLEMAESPETNKLMSNIIGSAVEMAEILQRITIHNWDNNHLVYELSRPSFKARLVDGWLPFDTALRQIVLKRGGSRSDKPVFGHAVNFGTLDDLMPPATAEIAEPGIGTLPTPFPNADDNEIAPHWWLVLERYIQGLGQRWGLSLENVVKGRTVVQSDLVIETTGSGRFPNGIEVGVYVSFRFHEGRAAYVTCMLTPPFDGYRLCTSLTDQIRFAN
jgi:hypothetical protein